MGGSGDGSESSGSRIGWFDNVKLIAIICVAIDHAIMFAPGALEVGVPSVSVTVRGTTLGAIAKFVVDPAMPLFFLMSGAVASAELTAERFIRSVTGLLLPALLAQIFKQLFVYSTPISWRLGVPFLESGLQLAGGLWTLLDDDDLWFLPTLFFLRVLYLPFVGKMRTSRLIPSAVCGWIAFLLYTTGKSVNDGAQSDTYVARAFIYMPYYTTGFLFKRHRIFKRFLTFADTNPRPLLLARLLSLGYIVALFVTPVATGKTIAWYAHVDGEGCRGAPAPITTMPTWPALDRWPQVGCICLYQPLLWLNLAALTLLTPYNSIRSVTSLGTRTLSAYCFMQIQWNVTALALRGVAALGRWPAQGVLYAYSLPQGLSDILFVLLPTILALAFCSEKFHYIAEPLMTPVWANGWFDADAPPNSSAWTFSWRWLVAFGAFGFLTSAVSVGNLGLSAP